MISDREMERILREEPDEDKVLQAIHEYRAQHIEDKQYICNLLCAALRATRDQHDLKSLTYQEIGPDEQQVTIAWENGGTSVNVSMDSGIAMMRDILKAL